ncbi:unnamed protein product [Rodentolepis nana]|uniref:EF-hand domain-containing protein n=1 Tax=Rodentolepis nana TaxID=102285 RepID=A0A0R3TQ36_RODNA|nr:unnamed protein product [Rodentolepis nana]
MLTSWRVSRFIKRHDLDSNKKLDANELYLAFINYNLSRADIEEFIRKYDLNNDNQLDKNELKIVFKQFRISIKVHRFIKKVDRDKSKTVDVNELLIALEGTGITREALTDFISLYDINGDGELDKRELKLFFKEQRL